MTPEERAAEAASGWFRNGTMTAALEKNIAAAIREAVKAEREGAAATAEATRRDVSTGGAYAVWNRACNRIAAAIRERPL